MSYTVNYVPNEYTVFTSDGGARAYTDLSTSTHNDLATAHGLTAGISAGLTAASSPGANNKILVDSDLSATDLQSAIKYIAPSSLVAYWPLTEESGTTLVDISGNGYNATGSSITVGTRGLHDRLAVKIGAAAGSINAYSAGFAGAFPTAEGSILIAHRPSSVINWADGTNDYMVNLYSNSTNMVRVFRSSTANTVLMDYFAGGTLSRVTLNIKANDWVIFALTWSKSADRVWGYINGRLLYHATLSGLGVWSGALGASTTEIGSFFGINQANGQLQHCALWSTPLSADQIWRICRNFVGPTPENATAINASAALTIPTSDGSGQQTHPDVVYVPGAWNGYKYWMAMTPYPASDVTKENPEIVASNDGTTWAVPVGLTNPIEPTPGDGYNSDVDLILGQDNVLYCIWRWIDGASTQAKFYGLKSTDGVTWTDKTEILSFANSGYLSPCLLWDGTQYVMYYVFAGNLIRRTSSAVLSGWSAEQACSLTAASGVSAFHINMMFEDGLYTCLLTTSESSTNKLRVAQSKDGILFETSKFTLIDITASGFDNGRIYRAAGVRRSDDLIDMWYSAQSGAGAWRVGITTISGI